MSEVPAPSIYSISGKVTGAPGVTLVLTGPATATTTTAANGAFNFGGLPNGNYTITPSLPGYAFSQVSLVRTVSDADVAIPAFTADPATTTYSITGTTGIPGVTIALKGNENGGSVLTGAGGTYTFVGLVPGSYTIIPSRDGYSFSPNSLPVKIDTQNSTANFTATAKSG
ncbi:MAG: carboxypeptidase-like regulatory domain-containing protein [Pseudomonadota bacterium]